MSRSLAIQANIPKLNGMLVPVIAIVDLCCITVKKKLYQLKVDHVGMVNTMKIY